MDSDPAASLEDYLADGEGLHGSARMDFLSFLRKAFGFKVQWPQWVVPALSLWVAGVGMGGLACEVLRGSSVVGVLLWLVVIGLGVALVAGFIRALRQPLPINRELEWRVYCMLIRPVILAERPGLLDRNLRGVRGTEDLRATIGSGPSVKDLLKSVRRIHLWVPAVIGWSGGSAALILWQVILGPERWTFILPWVGTVLGPIVWGLFRLTTLARMERAIQDQH